MTGRIFAAMAAVAMLTACGGDEQRNAQTGDAGPAASTADEGAVVLTRDAAVGARYNASGPRSCSPKNLPKDGPPSTAQAAAYVICDAEKESGGNLYLTDKLVVTDVAPGRTYERNQGARYNIDTNKPVYAIRGSMESYQCRPTYGEAGRGNNCAVTHSRNAEGDCYRTTSGDWRCFMVDPRALINELTDEPPPS